MTSESYSSFPWMDRVWMQKVLRDVEKDQTLSITDYHVRDSSSKGDHNLSEIHRITIHLQRAGNSENKMSLIAKKLPSGKEMQRTLAQSASFPNEIRVFGQILPRCQALLQHAEPNKFQPFAARHVYSQDNIPYFLIVSDLTPEGYRMATRQRGLDLEHCLLVMRTLGRFHAATVALHKSDPRLVESFNENLFSEKSSSDFMEHISNASIISLAKVVRSWPNGGDAMASKLMQVAETFCRQIKGQLLPEGNRLNVLAHGDLWTNNLLFKYSDVTGKVEDVRFVDFQLACYASCAIDLQYFMHTSPRDDVRVAHTEDILREYHSELCSTLELLGLAEKAITFQELLDEYEKKGIYGFLISLFILPLFMADRENSADMEALFKGGDPSTDSRAANKEYVKVMKRLLPLFQKKGYF